MFDKCLQCQTDDETRWKAHRYRADAYYDLKNYSEAIKDYEQAIMYLSGVTDHNHPVRTHLYSRAISIFKLVLYYSIVLLLRCNIIALIIPQVKLFTSLLNY